jgi:hypothetical protein
MGLEAVKIALDELLQAITQTGWNRRYYGSFCAGMPTKAWLFLCRHAYQSMALFPGAVKVHCANNGAWIGAMDFMQACLP